MAERWTALLPQLNERTRRLTAAAESRAIGRGGVPSRTKSPDSVRPPSSGPAGSGRGRRGDAPGRGAAPGGGGPRPTHTAQFAVYTIERWWTEPGQTRYPAAHDLYIVADGGSSHAVRGRLWKVGRQRFATASGLTIHVSHFPPGTSKWNYMERRLFSFISTNWRGRPLTTFETIVDWIGHTRTQTGLTVWAEWDKGTYPTGIRITYEELDALALEYDAVWGQWN